MVLPKAKYLAAHEAHQRHDEELASEPDKDARLIPELPLEVARIDCARNPEHE